MQTFNKKTMKKIISIFVLLIFIFSCTDLTEELNDTVTADVAKAAGDTESLLTSAYQALRPFNTQDNIYVTQSHVTDEMAGPTRGGDWDDAGIWRQLHLHTWSSSHPYIAAGYTTLLSGIFRSTQVLDFNPTPEQAAEARFLRAFFSFHAEDNFGIVLGREPGENLTDPPSITLKRADGIDFVISELEEILSTLPTNVSAGKASRNAGNFLLAKAYLNRAVYKASDPETNAASKGPFSFDAADMNKVIAACDAIMASGEYELATTYFDNFSPTNSNDSSENIFVGVNERGNNTSNTHSRWHMTLHYNTEPSGWNGFVTLADLYESFAPGDQRLKYTPPYFAGNTGLNAGFNVGPQVNKSGNPIMKRDTPGQLSFSTDFSLTNSTEEKGIRLIKYPMDFVNNDQPGNDYVFFRYADVLLMKAEAILRGGSATLGDTPLSLVNDIRTIRGATAMTSVDLTALLAERRRELYWEGWRRNDQIRFGTYLNAAYEKPASTETYLLFPIPPSALSSNPNLKQNPGY
jgi:hypothetical protein